MTYINPAAIEAEINALSVDSAIWKRFTIPHTAFWDPTSNKDIELFQLPAAGVIQAVRMRHTIAFKGTAFSSYTLSLGIIGSLAKYAPAFDVFQAPTVQQLSTITGIESPTVATSIRLAAFTGGAKPLNLSTAGSVDISVLYGKS